MRVLVAHPGMQHAHQLAWALEEQGQLVGLWTGVPVVDSRNPGAEIWSHFPGTVREVPVNVMRRSHTVLFPLLRRLASHILSTGGATEFAQLLDSAFDTWVAKRVLRLRPDMVVCYENAARETFRAARGIGAVCVLDAAGVHYSVARELGGQAVPTNPSRVDHRKQEEIDLADAILTCSQFAANTYLAGGVRADKLYPTPLGTEMGLTQAAQGNQRGPLGPLRKSCEIQTDGPKFKHHEGLLNFVFVGSSRRLKGLDLLLDVWSDLQTEDVPATLTLIGGGGEADLVARARGLKNIRILPYIPQNQLFEEVGRHDCLVLPSRFDSFGMVVPEAMAVGVPALVSDRVGAKCIIEQHSQAGWIVPFDRAALKAQMLWLIDHRAALALASTAARRAAQDYSWPRYRQRVVQTLASIHARFATTHNTP